MSRTSFTNFFLQKFNIVSDSARKDLSIEPIKSGVLDLIMSVTDNSYSQVHYSMSLRILYFSKTKPAELFLGYHWALSGHLLGVAIKMNYLGSALYDLVFILHCIN